MNRSGWKRAVLLLAVALVVAGSLFPFLWAAASSLKPRGELFATPIAYWPGGENWSRVTLQSYVAIFEGRDFGRNILNSAVVCALVVLVSQAVGALGGYALGRMRFRGRRMILHAVLGMTMFPQISILGALFVMVRSAGIFNTWWALVTTYLTFTLPFTIWAVTSFVKRLPDEIEEAALVDGATPLQVFTRIVVPLLAPVLVTTGLLTFIAAWNEFLFALTFTIDDSSRTIPPAIAFFSGATRHEVPWGEILAASVVVTLPLAVLVVVFQRRIVSGLAAGALKG